MSGERSALDSAQAVRKGEELDAERLLPYLQSHIEGLQGPLSIQQFAKGHSNLTYLLRAGERELVLRRPPFGSKVKTAHDMGREFRILDRLHRVFAKAPRPLAFCEDDAVMGANFYVMDRVRGVIVRKDYPAELELSPARVRAINESLVDTLAELHALDYEQIGLGDLGKPAGYVERQVSGWSKRYVGSQTDAIPAIDAVSRWLSGRIPTERGSALIHNDYKLDNVVLDPNEPTRIVGVLDWEMSTIGDPLMDLGTMLSYWIEPGDDDAVQMIRWAPTTASGSMTRAELAARYAEKTGRDVSNVLYYYVFGLFKTAVVLQQIYYRYKQGLTKDERFASLIMGVQILASSAERAIEAGKL